jgi:hypothetical protein
MRAATGTDGEIAWTDDRVVLDAGLAFRPLEQTVLDTLAWDRTQPGDRPTLTPEREQEILAAR